MNLEWNDLSVILAIGRSGTLAGAARTLGVNHSTVFRKLNAIERKTDVRFFDRLADGYVLTRAGEATCQVAERIESDVRDLGTDILGRDLRLQGKIRVTAPEGLATGLAPALVADFKQAHPDISIELDSSFREVDLVRREADVALRLTAQPPGRSLGRKICDVALCVYASPAYLKGNAHRALADQDWVVVLDTVDRMIPLIWKTRSKAESQIAFSSNSISAARAAARAGMGVTVLPCFLGDKESGLVRASRPISGSLLSLWVLTHPDLRRTARVTAFMAYIVDALKNERNLFEGKQPTGVWDKLLDAP